MISVVKAVACLGLLVTAAVSQLHAQDKGIWRLREDSSLAGRPLARPARPNSYSTFALDKANIRRQFNRAPEEFRGNKPDAIVEIPMPDGSLAKFRFEHSLVVEPGLLEKFPELAETYRGYGVDDPSATVRFDLLPTGFHAMILSASGTVVVDPYATGDTDNYISYFKSDLPRSQDFQCRVGEKTLDDFLTSTSMDSTDFMPEAAGVVSGTQLRTYRLALAATNEYAVAVGGNTVAGTLAAQVAIMNRVNGVYERDLAIHMNIIANNDLIVYSGDRICGSVACSATNDPYTNSSGTTMLTENTTNLNATILSANYDIGHVFSTGGGGVATLNGPCGANKARGVTGLSNPVGDAFAIDYVAHEMGHQWGGNHTFNGSVSNCSGGTRVGSAAFEPGSGITIMAYAGICGNQDLALHSVDTFHVRSLEEITAYSQTGNGNTCAVTTSTANTPPTVSVVGGPTFNVPKQTPFTLTASANDVNGDTITYDWQEYDLGAPTTSVPNTDIAGAMPIFRVYAPTTSPSRTFPSLSNILGYANVPQSTFNCGRGAGSPCLTGELMPQIGRSMTFKVIARDNRPNGGGVSTANATVEVDGASGPFVVTAPNSAISLSGNSQQMVTWNVANTSNAPVNAANVKISFSSDGGNTFPTVLAANAPNNGSAIVTMPNVSTSAGRIKVESATGIFFDISDANFTVTPGVIPTTHAISDFDGDGKSDVSIWRDSDGVWYCLNSSNGLLNAAQFGIAGDRMVPGDYDGDGKTDFAIWRPTDGTWYLQQSTAGFAAIKFGLSTDLPAQGDFDGDGKMDAAVFRPATGTWYILQSTAGFTAYQFGTAGDRPVAGDFDGDGKSDPAVFRPSTGVWYKLGSLAGFSGVQFGIASDKVVPADYDGDGKTDPAVFRGSEGTWYILGSMNGFSSVRFGSEGDVPSPGDFDGDGKADTNVYRPAAGMWYRLNSSNGALSATSFGVAADRPTQSSYVPVQ